MLNVLRRPWGAAALCAAMCGIAASPAWCAAPTFKVLYHEAIKIQTRAIGGRQQRMHVDAYGKSFDLLLEPNDGIRAAVPAGRQDIQPLTGTVEGQSGSWVRITQTRAGWRGMLFDGQELYAIEPAADIADALVQPLAAGSATAPVMYRLADALMTVGPAFCETLNADNPTSTTSSTDTLPGAPQPAPSDQASAKKVFQAVAKDLAAAATQFPTERLMTGVVADYEFVTRFSDDPEGAIIARMDIVDGIFSTQVGVKISLAPLTLINTSQEPFTEAGAANLLAQLRHYRGGSSTQMSLGVTHLMTGRDLDGSTVGIAYMGSVCQGDTAVSLSEGSHSTTMSALIAAHELGHNFNAPHDGDANGACGSTPPTFLMAPQINMSNQFSSCSLRQMHNRIQGAQCLTAYIPPDVATNAPATPVSAAPDTAFTLTFSAQASGDDASSNVIANATLPANLTLQSANVTGGGTCTQGAGTVTCLIGTLASGDSREVSLSLKGNAAGTSSVTVDVSSANDSNASNDSATMTANISEAVATAPPPPPAQASASSGSGSGGGGKLDDIFLLVLTIVLTINVVRTTRARQTRRNR